jgi:hypothetical protein
MPILVLASEDEEEANWKYCRAGEGARAKCGLAPLVCCADTPTLCTVFVQLQVLDASHSSYVICLAFLMGSSWCGF